MIFRCIQFYHKTEQSMSSCNKMAIYNTTCKIVIRDDVELFESLFPIIKDNIDIYYLLAVRKDSRKIIEYIAKRVPNIGVVTYYAHEMTWLVMSDDYTRQYRPNTNKVNISVGIYDLTKILNSNN